MPSGLYHRDLGNYKKRTPVSALPTGVLCLYSAASKTILEMKKCGQGRVRTADTRIFSPMLYQLSYLTDGYFSRCFRRFSRNLRLPIQVIDTRFDT
jgi:hypothetical protein